MSFGLHSVGGTNRNSRGYRQPAGESQEHLLPDGVPLRQLPSEAALQASAAQTLGPLDDLDVILPRVVRQTTLSEAAHHIAARLITHARGGADERSLKRNYHFYEQSLRTSTPETRLSDAEKKCLRKKVSFDLNRGAGRIWKEKQKADRSASFHGAAAAYPVVDAAVRVYQTGAYLSRIPPSEAIHVNALGGPGFQVLGGSSMALGRMYRSVKESGKLQHAAKALRRFEDELGHRIQGMIVDDAVPVPDELPVYQETTLDAIVDELVEGHSDHAKNCASGHEHQGAYDAAVANLRQLNNHHPEEDREAYEPLSPPSKAILRGMFEERMLQTAFMKKTNLFALPWFLKKCWPQVSTETALHVRSGFLSGASLVTNLGDALLRDFTRDGTTLFHTWVPEPASGPYRAGLEALLSGVYSGGHVASSYMAASRTRQAARNVAGFIEGGSDRNTLTV